MNVIGQISKIQPSPKMTKTSLTISTQEGSAVPVQALKYLNWAIGVIKWQKAKTTITERTSPTPNRLVKEASYS